MLAMTSGIAFRLARAAVFAAVCVVTAGLGHTLMSGAGLPWWAVGYTRSPRRRPPRGGSPGASAAPGW
ncbi:hypothetical protein ACRJ4W_06960 [Streptomyces sp. GLT-R25]